MSAATFLLILAVVLVVFVGFVIKSWFELSNVTRTRRKDEDQDRDHDPGDPRH